MLLFCWNVAILCQTEFLVFVFVKKRKKAECSRWKEGNDGWKAAKWCQTECLQLEAGTITHGYPYDRKIHYKKN